MADQRLQDLWRQFEVPRWQYEAWRRWFLPSDEARESREIKADAERQAGER